MAQEHAEKKPHNKRVKKKPRGVFENTPGSGVWYVRYYDDKGKRQRYKVGVYEDAVAEYNKQKRLVSQERYEEGSTKRKKDVLLSEAIKEYLEEAAKLVDADMMSRDHYEAQAHYGGIWKQLLPGMSLNEIEAHNIKTAVTEIRQQGVHARKCTACLSEHRVEIDRRLKDGESCRSVARWLRSLGELGNHRALSIHKQNHAIGTGDVGEKRPKAVSTVNRYLAMLQALYTWASEKDYCITNPVQKFKRGAKKKRQLQENNERVRILATEELAAILECLPTKYHPALLISLGTGLRLSEQLSLRWRDVDLQGGWITVGENATRSRRNLGRKTKGKRDRKVPIDKSMDKILRALPSRNRSEWVFPAVRNDGPMGRHGGVRQAFDKAVTAAEVEDFTWHDCRHTYASHLAMDGVPLNTIREILGHSSLRMVQRYAHLQPDHIKEAVRGGSIFTKIATTQKTTHSTPNRHGLVTV